MIRSSDELAWHRRHALLTGNVELQEGHLGPLVWQCVPGFPSGIRISRARRNWTHMRGLSFLKNLPVCLRHPISVRQSSVRVRRRRSENNGRRFFPAGQELAG